MLTWSWERFQPGGPFCVQVKWNPSNSVVQNEAKSFQTTLKIRFPIYHHQNHYCDILLLDHEAKEANKNQPAQCCQGSQPPILRVPKQKSSWSAEQRKQKHNMGTMVNHSIFVEWLDKWEKHPCHIVWMFFVTWPVPSTVPNQQQRLELFCPRENSALAFTVAPKSGHLLRTKTLGSDQQTKQEHLETRPGSFMHFEQFKLVAIQNQHIMQLYLYVVVELGSSSRNRRLRKKETYILRGSFGLFFWLHFGACCVAKRVEIKGWSQNRK